MDLDNTPLKRNYARHKDRLESQILWNFFAAALPAALAGGLPAFQEQVPPSCQQDHATITKVGTMATRRAAGWAMAVGDGQQPAPQCGAPLWGGSSRPEHRNFDAPPAPAGQTRTSAPADRRRRHREECSCVGEYHHF